MGAESLKEHKGVEVIDRNDNNDRDVVTHIAASLEKFCAMGAKESRNYANSALNISQIALWENLIVYYQRAYSLAIERMITRSNRVAYEGGGAYNEQINFVKQQLISTSPPGHV